MKFEGKNVDLRSKQVKSSGFKKSKIIWRSQSFRHCSNSFKLLTQNLNIKGHRPLITAGQKSCVWRNARRYHRPVLKLIAVTAPQSCIKLITVSSNFKLWRTILPFCSPTATTSTAGAYIQYKYSIEKSIDVFTVYKCCYSL